MVKNSRLLFFEKELLAFELLHLVLLHFYCCYLILHEPDDPLNLDVDVEVDVALGLVLAEEAANPRR